MRIKIKVHALSQSTTAYLKLIMKQKEFSTNPEQVTLIFFFIKKGKPKAKSSASTDTDCSRTYGSIWTNAFYNCTWIKHINFSSSAHNIVMVCSMTNWSFILVFCKRLGYLQPLSKIVISFSFFFLILREERLHGWGGRLWERNTGNEWDIHRRRALKTQRMNEDGICWKMNKRSLSLEYEYIMQLRLCMWNGVHSLLQNVQTSRLSHLNSK